MPMFRKRPVVIEALQLRWDTWSEICEFAGVGKLADGKPQGGYSPPGAPHLYPEGDAANMALAIPTLEGVMIARLNDWVIRGVAGELYACKPDIFEQTYEPVSEEG